MIKGKSQKGYWFDNGYWNEETGSFLLIDEEGRRVANQSLVNMLTKHMMGIIEYYFAFDVYLTAWFDADWRSTPWVHPDEIGKEWED